jgi:hypothetical protein
MEKYSVFPMVMLKAVSLGLMMVMLKAEHLEFLLGLY